MCGIAGIINKEGVDGEILNAMSKILRHRGPDDEGFSIINTQFTSLDLKGDDTISEFSSLNHICSLNQNANSTIGLLHRRLSILDLTSAGHQPMRFKNDLHTIVFNGEIYNYKELKKELTNHGYQFNSETDTEIILASYDFWGTSCVSKFSGMWAFAIVDNKKQQLFLSRDRFGIKPLYFFKNKNIFAFASEIKALLAIDDIKPEANIDAVFEYISFGATANPNKILFENIIVLPPSHNLIVNVADLKTNLVEYYNLSNQVKNYSLPNNINTQKYFNDTLNDSVNLHLRADVSIGSTLSGGLDSSTLVAMVANKMSSKTFKTFTAAYHESEIDESYFAKKVVSDYSNIKDYYTYPQINNYWHDIDKLIWHQDLPINSTSMFAQWEVMKLAKEQNIKVLLDGQGADEILGGYYNFAGVFLLDKIKKAEIKTFFDEKNKLQQNFSPNINSTIGKAFYYYLPEFAQRKIRNSKRISMGSITDIYKEKMALIDVPARGGKNFREQSILSVNYGLQDLLRYEDRNSMAFSIESRVPFLDHKLVELSIALNNNWKIKDGWTKYILRKSAEPILNKEVVWRKYKMGFLTPQQLWKNQSKNEINQFLNDVPIPSFINKDYLLKLNNTDISHSSHLSEFWKIISFLKWAQIFKITF